jgi:hypothetical protein
MEFWYKNLENFDTMDVEDTNILNLAKNQNSAMRRRFSTKDSQDAYKTGKMIYLNRYFFYLMWLYYILSTVYLGILFISPSAPKYSAYYKVGVLLVLVIFPYIATPIEMFLLKMLTFIIETTMGNVYERPDYEYVLDYNAVPNLFSY